MSNTPNSESLFPNHKVAEVPEYCRYIGRLKSEAREAFVQRCLDKASKNTAAREALEPQYIEAFNFELMPTIFGGIRNYVEKYGGLSAVEANIYLGQYYAWHGANNSGVGPGLKPIADDLPEKTQLNGRTLTFRRIEDIFRAIIEDRHSLFHAYIIGERPTTEPFRPAFYGPGFDNLQGIYSCVGFKTASRMQLAAA